MTEWLLALVPQYGLWLLAACTFCSCVALPVPASVLMLAAGGFVSAGDLPLAGCIMAALAGALAGDHVGYFGGRWGGTKLLEKLGPRAGLISRATDMLANRGGLAVFFSRWLVSALGPYVNVAAGIAEQPLSRFMAWSIAGEVVWVSLYIGLGYAFTGNIQAASAMALNLLGLLAAGAITLGLTAWLILVLRSDKE